MTIIKTSLDYLQQKNLNMRLIEWFWVMYLKFAFSNRQHKEDHASSWGQIHQSYAATSEDAYMRNAQSYTQNESS